MAAQYGCLEEFRPESDSIRAYLERAALYFLANDIGENKRVPILLSSIGASTYMHFYVTWLLLMRQEPYHSRDCKKCGPLISIRSVG